MEGRKQEGRAASAEVGGVLWRFPSGQLPPPANVTGLRWGWEAQQITSALKLKTAHFGKGKFGVRRGQFNDGPSTCARLPPRGVPGVSIRRKRPQLTSLHTCPTMFCH